jgi:enamine deaminase RidA (YjgF/YER057c/UK114 family)
MPHSRIIASLAGILLLGQPGLAADKKEKEEETQVLEILRDPPAAITADAERLVFLVSPLSTKGLLSRQVRDGLKALSKAARGAAIVKIRAFVSGSGDLRRVQAIVSETFSDKRREIPALSVVQVGGLPVTGSYVVLEAVGSNKKAVNSHGLAFISGQSGTAAEAGAGLQKAVMAAQVEPASVRRVTCFFNSLEHVSSVRSDIAKRFPKAAANYVQLQRGSMGDFVECEAIGALSATPQERLAFVEPREKAYSQAALVAPGKLVLTGTQLAFGARDEDIRLAFERLGKALEEMGVSFNDVAMSRVYPLTKTVSDKVREARFSFYDAKNPPASTLLLFEGLPSLDASFGIDVIAVAKR